MTTLHLQHLAAEMTGKEITVRDAAGNKLCVVPIKLSS
jgi:hypothetical protein